MKFRTCLAALVVCLAAASEAAAQAKTLVFCSQESPDFLNPQLSTRQATFDATSRQIYDRLTAPGPTGSEIVPALAESWEKSADGLRYWFILRRGVSFHETANFTPSRPLNANDVVFSFMRQLDEANPYHSVSGGSYPYFRGLGLEKALESITAEDDRTVVFQLRSPWPALPAALSMDFASILSAEYADAMLVAGTPERVDTEPVGTGPFQFDHYARDSLIRYVAHPGYWRGKAPLDNLIFSIVPDAAVRYQKLRDGECHVIAEPDPADIPAMTLDPNIKLISQTGIDVGYLLFNTRKPPLNDKRVRQALALAVDRGAILDRIYQDFGRPAASIIPQVLRPDRQQTSRATAPDLQRARQLLDDADVSGLEIEIWPSPVSRPYMPDARHAAEMIREDWLKIGVDAKIVVSSGRDFIKKTMVGVHDVAIFGWIAEIADPSLVLSPILGCDAVKRGGNRTFWCNATFDRLLEDVENAPTASERAVLLNLAQQLLDQEMPVVPIASSVRYLPVRRDVLNFHASALGGYYFYGVDRE